MQKLVTERSAKSTVFWGPYFILQLFFSSLSLDFLGLLQLDLKGIKRRKYFFVVLIYLNVDKKQLELQKTIQPLIWLLQCTELNEAKRSLRYFKISPKGISALYFSKYKSFEYFKLSTSLGKPQKTLNGRAIKA